MIVALPGTVSTGFAPCVSDLNTGHSSCVSDLTGDTSQPFDMVVTPQPQTGGRNPPLGQYTGCFNNHQPRTAARQACVMRQVPVIHKPVGRHVLAHRRHRDTITQLHVF